MPSRAVILALGLGAAVSADPDPGFVCIGCTLIKSLALEGAFNNSETHLFTALDTFVTSQSLNADGKTPDEICKNAGLCLNETCAFYDPAFGPAWEDVVIPGPQPDWPVQAPAPVQAASAAAAEVATAASAAAELGEADLRASLARVGSWLAGRGALAADEAGSLVERRSLREVDGCNRTDVSCILTRFGSLHIPLFDGDGDRFSDHDTLRGAHWRGRDCDNKDPRVHPGRKAASGGGDAQDHDCNGVSGVDPATGVGYEEQWCGGVERRGLAILGDSATAHFHVPPTWLTASGWSASTVLNAASLTLAEDELDVPACSWGTAVDPDVARCPYMPPASVPTVDSLYLRLRARNRCNHRDFQNVGVNGARVTSSMGLVESLARDGAADHPLLVVFALIGNDVCNGHPGSEHMTTVEDFQAAALASLTALDAKLPTGSTVLALSLVDGRVIWNATSAEQHPVGSSYPQLYHFLDCSGEVNPCWGWLNSDPAWRDFTSERAFNLSATYDVLAAEESFANFNLLHYTPDWPKLFADYAATGGDPYDLIEKTDGFHPSQLGQTLLAGDIWAWLEATHPEALGPVNPFNDLIDATFGDQGGH